MFIALKVDRHNLTIGAMSYSPFWMYMNVKRTPNQVATYDFFSDYVKTYCGSDIEENICSETILMESTASLLTMGRTIMPIDLPLMTRFSLMRPSATGSISLVKFTRRPTAMGTRL